MLWFSMRNALWGSNRMIENLWEVRMGRCENRGKKTVVGRDFSGRKELNCPVYWVGGAEFLYPGRKAVRPGLSVLIVRKFCESVGRRSDRGTCSEVAAKLSYPCPTGLQQKYKTDAGFAQPSVEFGCEHLR